MAVIGVYVPMWFLEGDATVFETSVGKSGRGRSPEFLNEMKAQVTEKGIYTYYKAVLGSYKESLDANVFTFGLGTEYLAKFGALNVTPHAGIRLSRIDMDDSKYGADYDAMTVYQLPLGVAFSGNFDVNGWKLAPMVDLSVVPAFGDKDAVATYTGGIQSVTRVVDTNPIQATLGVSAQNGAWTFGLNYGLTAGGDDRMNNAFNANLRYSF